MEGQQKTSICILVLSCISKVCRFCSLCHTARSSPLTVSSPSLGDFNAMSLPSCYLSFSVPPSLLFFLLLVTLWVLWCCCCTPCLVFLTWCELISMDLGSLAINWVVWGEGEAPMTLKTSQEHVPFWVSLKCVFQLFHVGIRSLFLILFTITSSGSFDFSNIFLE